MPAKTRKSRAKPFPLYKHGSGQWAKTVEGKKRYYGTDRDAALKQYLKEKDDGGKRKPKVEEYTVGDIIGLFRATKLAAHEVGEISALMIKEYKLICQTISRSLGKHTLINDVASEDLTRLKTAIAKGKNGKLTSPVSFKRRLTYARSVFLYANEEKDCHVRYRKPMASPAARTIRKHRNEIGEQLFSAEEIRGLIKVASDQMKAMIWLGITVGFGNRDCATLPIEQVDLVGGWHNYWRPKTQQPRRAPLTAECVEALTKVIGNRKKGLVFMTKYGRPWYHEEGNRCPIAAEFRKLCVKTGIYKPRITQFYSLRRTFQTVGEMSGEPLAVKHMMGHVPSSHDMSAVYRQKAYDQPMLRASAYLRSWVLGEIEIS